ncbi:protein transport protein HofC [Candidatus Fukatsuia symbiotica]|uniref:Type IV pilin biogenesis protein n=1 Tax=Candidatus Fukatsuia symbiotica TaxID=1878942 RepID=A0A2U8I6X5_9GAMM|nr:protein transport protein HofC [Candidatus Fukatsuia symbiotica]AWK14926.1 type IV pilin biogenesis protein [Candidatus Fukatsuia symbiotica]MEA9445281.1 protein transport protein HofC [Candidatus Fukatsuia symbiotica]
MNSRRLYRWQAINKNGYLQEDIFLATEKTAVYEHIIKHGLQPISIKSGKRIADSYWQGEHLTTITRQLATLLQSSLPLVNSLQLLAKEAEAPAWRCLLHEISQKVIQGLSFSEAIGHYPQIFPALYCQLIAVGELTGNLDQCCSRLAEQQEQQQQLQKKVSKALRYPLFVCVITLLVSIVMLVIVLPQFAEIYQSFAAPLPLLTRGLLFLSDMLIGYGLYVILLLTVMGVGYCRKLRKIPHWRQREQACLLRLPFFSALIRGNCLGQIFQTLAMTQISGLTLAAGLQAAALSVNNFFYQQAIYGIYQQIVQGTPLHHALSQYNLYSSRPLFPPLCQQLIRVGEESGSLDLLLEKLAYWHQQQTQELADSLTQMLEPILMLVVGTIVGVLVIAMYLPIFQLGNIME